MMTDYGAWAKALHDVLAELSTQDFGYPLGKNEVRDPGPRVVGLPTDLQSLYEVCDGAAMPDVHVGYFVDPAGRVASAPERGEPVRIEGTASIPIVVFGSDGGGNRFAMAPNGRVYYLPASGAVIDGAFREDSTVSAAVKATTLLEFLWILHADAEAFMRGEEKHVYLSDRPSAGS